MYLQILLLVLIDCRKVRPIDELDDAFPPAVPHRAALEGVLPLLLKHQPVSSQWSVVGGRWSVASSKNQYYGLPAP